MLFARLLFVMALGGATGLYAAEASKKAPEPSAKATQQQKAAEQPAADTALQTESQSLSLPAAAEEAPKSENTQLSADDKKLQELIAQNCLSCHNSTKKAGKVSLEKMDEVMKMKRKILATLKKGKMPPNNPKWSKSPNGNLLIELLSAK
jgi:mono/diheme cytochrome c family protein